MPTTRLLGRAGLSAALCLAAGAGCAGPGGAARAPAPIVRAAPAAPPGAAQAAAEPGAAWRAEVVLRAMSLLGVNYRFGGSSPETGLDCSGLVRHVFREALGTVLPRRAEDISRAGRDIDPRQLKPGDLVFFNTLRRTFSHVGIYIGDNRFVHAPATGGQVRIEAMDQPYWLARFDGARRLEQPHGGAPGLLRADAPD